MYRYFCINVGSQSKKSTKKECSSNAQIYPLLTHVYPLLYLYAATCSAACYSHGKQEEEDAAGVSGGGQAPPGLHQVPEGAKQGDAHRETHAGQRACKEGTMVKGQGSGVRTGT